MVPWHNEYLKLKEFEKRAETGRPLWTIPLAPFPWNKSLTFYVEGPLSVLGGKKAFLLQEMGDLGLRRLCKQILLNQLLSFCFFITYYPSPGPLVLSVLRVFIISLSQKYKSFMFWSLLWVFILLWRLTYIHKNKVCMFFSYKSIFVSLIFRPRQGL